MKGADRSGVGDKSSSDTLDAEQIRLFIAYFAHVKIFNDFLWFGISWLSADQAVYLASCFATLLREVFSDKGWMHFLVIFCICKAILLSLMIILLDLNQDVLIRQLNTCFIICAGLASILYWDGIHGT